jgi:hypothetical protein
LVLWLIADALGGNHFADPLFPVGHRASFRFAFWIQLFATRVFILVLRLIADALGGNHYADPLFPVGHRASFRFTFWIQLFTTRVFIWIHWIFFRFTVTKPLLISCALAR